MRFDVDVEAPALEAAYGDRQLLFHGVNKSGSLVFSDVLKEAFIHAGRGSEFISHYHKFPADYADFRTLVETARGPRFFVAHAMYGDIAANERQSWFTIFRHPLPRVVSVHSWLRKKHMARTPDEPFASLEEFVRTSRGLRHSQIWQFGVGFGKPASGEVQAQPRRQAKEVFDLCLERLSRDLAVVGLAERFEETIFLVARLAGLESVVAWRKDERNAERPLVDEIGQPAIDMIHDVFRYDFELYEAMKARFFAQLAEARFGPGLAAYQQACAGSYKDRLI